MKKSILYLCTIVLVGSSLFSCESKKQTLEFQSPDKATKVVINGSKPNFLDPWIIDIVVSSGKNSGTLKTEFHTSEIDTNSVKLIWQEENMAELKLIEQDDKVRTVLVRASEAGVQAQELTMP